MTHLNRLILVTAALAALSACDIATTVPQLPLPGQIESEGAVPGVAFGTVVNAQGLPIDGVTIDIHGTATANGGIVSYEAASDARGRYREEGMTPGTYRVEAWRQVVFNDRTYRLPLKPTTGKATDDFKSEDGIVRDFTWLISGPIPGTAEEPTEPDAYYGGGVELYGTDALMKYPELPEGTTLTLTLVPMGRLLDGSPGTTVTKTIPYTRSLRLEPVVDIPLGRYTMTVMANVPGAEPRPLRLSSGGIQDADYTGSVTVEFPPINAAVRPYGGNQVEEAAFYLAL